MESHTKVDKVKRNETANQTKFMEIYDSIVQPYYSNNQISMIENYVNKS